MKNTDTEIRFNTFLEKVKITHNDKYDYSKSDYINNYTKIIIICPIHGEFLQKPYSHLSGSGCKRCISDSRRNTNDYFIRKANEIHNNKYDYSLIEYYNAITKIIIKCKIHGEFKQTPNKHLNGRGCSKCARISTTEYNRNHAVGWTYSAWENLGNKSKNFDNYKLYIIKCYDENEEFYKVGKTFLTLKNRFNNKCMLPYKYDIIKIIKGGGREISILENELKNKIKKYKYEPKIKFGGMRECFKNNEINKTSLEMNKWLEKLFS
jgi:hypothetical protein